MDLHLSSQQNDNMLSTLVALQADVRVNTCTERSLRTEKETNKVLLS